MLPILGICAGMTVVPNQQIPYLTAATPVGFLASLTTAVLEFYPTYAHLHWGLGQHQIPLLLCSKGQDLAFSL